MGLFFWCILRVDGGIVSIKGGNLMQFNDEVNTNQNLPIAATIGSCLLLVSHISQYQEL